MRGGDTNIIAMNHVCESFIGYSNKQKEKIRMRTSVLAGLFACAALAGISLAFSPEKAGASAIASLETLQTTKSDTAVDHLIAVAEAEEAIEIESVEPTEEQEVVEEPEVITHQLAENETLSDVAKQYETTWKRIYDKNEAIDDPDTVNPGLLLIIPGPEEELIPRELPQPDVAPASAPSTSSQAVAAVSTPAPRGSSSGNLYAAGYCTWHVKNLRPDLPNNLGNANTWFQRAAAQGIPTGSTPRGSAAAQRNNHIAYVTAVNEDGTITISDMNYRSLYSVTTRTVPANEWRYIY